MTNLAKILKRTCPPVVPAVPGDVEGRTRRTGCPAGTKALYCLFFLALGASSVFAEQQLDGDKLTHGLVKLEKGYLYLYDRQHHNKHAIKVEKGKALLPHRAYLKYDVDLHYWIFFVTDFAARIPEPIEALRPDTVAPGAVIGSDLKLARYILDAGGTWMPTRATEEYKIWVKTEPPQLKSYTFERIQKPSPLPRGLASVPGAPTDTPKQKNN